MFQQNALSRAFSLNFLDSWAALMKRKESIAPVASVFLIKAVAKWLTFKKWGIDSGTDLGNAGP